MTAVVKYGGSAMDDAAARAAFAADVAALRAAGERVVVVHGGGPQITARLAERGVPSAFARGRRVTTPETMAVVAEVLAEVNAAVTALLAPHGAAVAGARVLTARPLDPALGLVGDVARVDPGPLRDLLDAGAVPVVSSVARGADGTAYNVNADTAAAAVAVALGATRAVFLTDVPGLYAAWPDEASFVERIAARDLGALLPALDGGMAPKMEACLRAVRGGVPRAHVLDGRVPHALTRGAGTTVVA